MNIKVRLNLVVAFVIFISLIFALTLYVLITQYKKASHKSQIATEIASSIFERKILASEYIQHRVSRAKGQWFAKQEAIKGLLNSNVALFSDTEEVEFVKSIQNGLGESESIFNQIIQNHEDASQSIENELLKDERLTSELAVKAQETILFAERLQKFNAKKAADNLNLIILVFSIAAILYLVLLIICAFIILSGLKKLQQNEEHLQQLNIKLQAIDKMKDEFVSVASHELRTPMTAIKGFISMIQEGDYGEVPKKLDEPLASVYSSTERLIHLVNDMLNLSRIEQGRLKYSITEFDLDKIIQECVDSLRPIAQQKKIVLTYKASGTLPVSSDIDKIKQILNNLMGNSLKFTDTGSITITTQDQDQHIKVYVADTGIGIKKEDQVNLFKKFEQISSQDAGRPQGTGLGLYISRQLAQKIGGDMWIEKSEFGQGSTFAFSVVKAETNLANDIKNKLYNESQASPDQKELS